MSNVLGSYLLFSRLKVKFIDILKDEQFFGKILFKLCFHYSQFSAFFKNSAFSCKTMFYQFDWFSTQPNVDQTTFLSNNDKFMLGLGITQFPKNISPVDLSGF